MVQIHTSTAYITASANRFNHTAHVSPDSTLVAFGSGRLVALWNVDASEQFFLAFASTNGPLGSKRQGCLRNSGGPRRPDHLRAIYTQRLSRQRRRQRTAPLLAKVGQSAITFPDSYGLSDAIDASGRIRPPYTRTLNPSLLFRGRVIFW